MKEIRDGRIHAFLDGDADPTAGTPDEKATLAKYRAALDGLQKMKLPAPTGLTSRIMAAIPRTRRSSLREWMEALLPQRRQWVVPALAGALAMLVVMLGVWPWRSSPGSPRVLVHFQIHAPGVQSVELVGDFNNWTPGALRLQGPDASGHWTADVELPEGRYEYQFLVNGQTWVTDPNATTRRPDGFGRENAVMDVYEERS
ncbi:MAG: isoamylase early set domain-containing protein [Verrucomicrobia bacterium]|nr:isoamylase early set domain-containing protein [Verrucomicrobiota bacterium]